MLSNIRNFISGDNNQKDGNDQTNGDSKHDVSKLKVMDRSFQNDFILKEDIKKRVINLKEKLIFKFIMTQDQKPSNMKLSLLAIVKKDKIIEFYNDLKGNLFTLEKSSPKKKYLYERPDFWKLGKDNIAICQSAEMQEQYRRAVQASSKPSEKIKLKNLLLLDPNLMQKKRREFKSKYFSFTSDDFIKKKTQ